MGGRPNKRAGGRGVGALGTIKYAGGSKKPGEGDFNEIKRKELVVNETKFYCK